MRSPRASLALAATAAALLCGCPDSPGNPDRLYLSLLVNELTVQLVEDEPDPF